MAQDDMYIIMYRVLAYIYDCNKKGIEPNLSEWDCRAMGISQPYWAQIMKELVNSGFVVGIEVYQSGKETKVVPTIPQITKEGVAFAQENSMMGRAKQFLTDIKASVPFI